ncbi:MAG TPA: hypothetical protein VM367_09940, partial [Pseudonocardia sp.]|nr:hypothetical protein [Pseudonocardia sp.]
MRRRPLEPAALLPGPRAGWIAAVVPAVAVLAIMTLRYRGTSTPGRLDRGADLLTETFAAGRRGPFHVLVGIGDPVPVVLIALVLGAVALRLGRRRLAFLAVAGPGATGLATIALKPVADRTIVNGGLAFPSGHTAAVTALGIVVALLVVAVRRSSSAAAAAWVAGGALAGGGG